MRIHCMKYSCRKCNIEIEGADDTIYKILSHEKICD
jgi:hypothetical protein